MSETQTGILEDVTISAMVWPARGCSVFIKTITDIPLLLRCFDTVFRRPERYFSVALM